MEVVADILQRLMAPIDASRAHQVGAFVSYHGRIMVFAWGVIVPLAIVTARFFKILPWQKWPTKLDNSIWWRIHWKGQGFAVGISFVGLALILLADISAASKLHRVMGYVVLASGLLQILSGVLRGSKGGPTDATLRGDHFDMTPRRRWFEFIHKSFGYALLAFSAATILTGLWAANGPLWMWLVLITWWAALAVAVLALQLFVGSYDTYQAHWGADPRLPGNKMNYRSFGSIRPGDQPKVWFRKPTDDN